MDSARRVIGCHLPQETRVHNALDDVARALSMRRYQDQRAGVTRGAVDNEGVWAVALLHIGLEVALEAGAFTRPLPSST